MSLSIKKYHHPTKPEIVRDLSFRESASLFEKDEGFLVTPTLLKLYVTVNAVL